MDTVETGVKKDGRCMKIQWKNTYSGEVGYVKMIRQSKGYFENGTLDEARCFRSFGECNKAIEVLNQIGEGAEKNNSFIITDSYGVAVTA